jgi:type I restriction enzyme, S subunit
MARLSLNSSRKTKNTPCGEIPVEWGCVRFKEIVSDAAYGLSLPTDHSGNITILKMNSIVSGKLSVHDLDSVTCTEAEIEQYSIKRGDILFNRTNSFDLVGKTAVVSKDARIVFASYLVRYRVTNQAVPQFIGYWFNYEKVQRRLKELATVGVSQSNINPTRLQHDLHVPLPPLAEQQEISDILGKWDEALEKLDALIGAKDRRKQALMRQLLTGARRLPGFNKKWVRAKLGDLFENRTESNRLDLSLLSITADHGVVRRDTLVKRDTSSEDKSKYLRIAPGDIGYNTMRMWQGVSALSSLEGIVSPAYTICIPTKHIDGQFVAHFFKLPHTISLFHRHSQGLVDDTLNLKFPHFATIEVTVPSDVTEQRAIAAVLDTADAELRLLRQQRTALDQQKRGLMQRLLTGTIRVSP